jgi:hypothetical protein
MKPILHMLIMNSLYRLQEGKLTILCTIRNKVSDENKVVDLDKEVKESLFEDV